MSAIWAASSGVGTMMKTLNRVYEVRETRPLPKRYALAVGLTLVTGVQYLIEGSRATSSGGVRI